MTAVLQQLSTLMWLWLLGLLGVSLLAGFLRSARFKGWLGERKVQRWLDGGLDPQRYHCLHNVTLRLADGSTTQIDHVVLSPYGIFVLETKHMQGWIFGNEKQQTWTQSIFRRRTSFQNPLRQNWRHIKALEEVLQVPLEHLHSVVVFTGDCSFKTAMPARVTQGEGCIAFIRSFGQEVCTPEEVEQWRLALKQQRLAPTRATHRAHVQQLQARHAPQAPAVARMVMPSAEALARKSGPLVPPALAPATAMEDAADLQPQRPTTRPPSARIACPDCGHELVRRSLPDSLGQSRAFWRCSYFPHCRFVLVDTVQEH